MKFDSFAAQVAQMKPSHYRLETREDTERGHAVIVAIGPGEPGERVEMALEADDLADLDAAGLERKLKALDKHVAKSFTPPPAPPVEEKVPEVATPAPAAEVKPAEPNQGPASA